jgi:hypothetical protein
MALMITLSFLAATLIVFTSIMYWISSSARVTQQNNLFYISQAAAQAATERVIAQMDRDFLYGTPNSTNVYMVLVQDIDQSSWPVQCVFSDTNGNQNQIYVSEWPLNWSTNMTYLNSQFPGLYADVANYNLIAVATPTNQGYNISAIVDEKLQLAAIPVFQFGVFYNLDLDFSPGQPLTMNGKVHCNGTIWMCPQALATFNDVVEASMVVTNTDNPNDQQNLSFSSGNLSYVLANQPVSHVDSLALPINGQSVNTNLSVEAILNLPTNSIAIPGDAGFQQTNQIYLYNECDLIISNSSTGINCTNSRYGTNLSVFFSDFNLSVSTPSNRLVLCTNDVQWTSIASIKTNPGPTYVTNYLTNCYYSFVTNATFYDFREGKTVQAVQLNVSNLCIWLTNQLTRTNGATTNSVAGYPWNYQLGGSDGAHGDKGRYINSVYIYNNVQLSSSTLPAVRVVMGQRLPTSKGLTIATPMPLYLLGDYNTTMDGVHFSKGLGNVTYAAPAALMGDSMTILSSSWNDNGADYLVGGNYNNRNASSTYINTACLEGIVVSTNISGGSSGKRYSGGLENFLRLLEDWSGNTLTYNGSIVVMFPSIYATNYWQTPKNYYNVPTRAWGFDANFMQPGGSPPCAPEAKALIRGSWTAGGQ